MELPSKYKTENWIKKTQSNIVQTIVSDDKSEMYEVDKFWIVKLENGRYATILEQGCSCYDSESAEIDILPDESAAREQYVKWLKTVEARNRY